MNLRTSTCKVTELSEMLAGSAAQPRIHMQAISTPGILSSPNASEDPLDAAL